MFAAVGLSGSRPAPAADLPTAADRAGPSLCQQYPQIPGLCHMSPSAARMWVAKASKNSRAVDREQERQEQAAAVNAPTMADVLTHTHQHQPATPKATAATPAPN